MTKQEILDLIKDFSESFPREALQEIRANKSDFIPELLESLDHAFHNAKELRETGSDYFMHTYAMYLLAEFRERHAFPKLVTLLHLPEDEISFILGDGLTEDFAQLLLCTFDNENLQMLLNIIENPDLYEWARLAAIRAYELLFKEGFVAKEEFIGTLRALIYDKLSPDDSYVVFTGIVGSVIHIRLYDMMADVRFLYDNDRVDLSMHGGYDEFFDWMFYKERPEPTFIDDAISEMERWACFKRADEGTKGDSAILDQFADEMKKGIAKERLIEQKKKKVGRNDPCPCGSGKKYKKCCIDKQPNDSSAAYLEDKYDLLDRYPKGSALFAQMYEKEAINIDMLAYKALHHRAIPVWVQRNLAQERSGKIDYLNEALNLFLDKCRREQITSFAAYDERYMVHYRSQEWVSAIIDLTEGDKTSKIKSIRQTATEAVQSFS